MEAAVNVATDAVYNGFILIQLYVYMYVQFLEISSLIYGYYSRAVCTQEQIMTTRVRETSVFLTQSNELSVWYYRDSPVSAVLISAVPSLVRFTNHKICENEQKMGLWKPKSPKSQF